MPPGIQERPANDDTAQSAGHDPDLAAVLDPARRRHRLIRGRILREDKAAPGRNHRGRRVEIVRDAVHDGGDQRPADRVDGSRRGSHAATGGLGKLEQPVQIPVTALTLGHGAVGPAAIVALVARDATHSSIGEGPDDRPDRPCLEHAVGVGEDHDLAGRLRQGSVERGGLPDPGQRKEPDPAVGERRDDGVRPVGRTVRGDEHLDPVHRIVQGQHVVQLRADAQLLVVRRDDETHVGGDVGRRHGPSDHPTANEQQGRKPDVRRRDRARGDPERGHRDPSDASAHQGQPAGGRWVRPFARRFGRL